MYSGDSAYLDIWLFDIAVTNPSLWHLLHHTVYVLLLQVRAKLQKNTYIKVDCHVLISTPIELSGSESFNGRWFMGGKGAKAQNFFCPHYCRVQKVQTQHLGLRSPTSRTNDLFLLEEGDMTHAPTAGYWQDSILQKIFKP